MQLPPLRRSFLYLSGAWPQYLAECTKLAADLFCLDLEDSVPAPDKEAARGNIREALAQDFGGRERLLRVNTLATPWGRDDLLFAADLAKDGRLDGVLLPKVEGAAAVRAVEEVLIGAGAPASLALWCMIETPLGVLDARAIATASPRICGLVIGGSDLVETLHARHTPDQMPLLVAEGQVVLVARAFGLAVIDAIHQNFTDNAGLEESCVRGKLLGFDGKSLALPGGTGIANRVFSPGSEEVAAATRQIEAARQAGDGAFYVTQHLEAARKILARADQVARHARRFGE